MLAPIYVATTSKPDGLSISTADGVLTPAINQVLGLEGMENIDVTKWNWICSMRATATDDVCKRGVPL